MKPSQLQRKASALLCSCLKAGRTDTLSLEMQIWWRDHKAADRRHKKEDANLQALKDARKAALAKLTAADRKALGV